MLWDKISLGFQILLVVAAVFLFSFFDPFGWLAPKRKKLEDTPISVVSIKGIGQLITAEYYGEVLSSLQGTLVEEIKVEENNSKFWKTVDSVFLQYMEALDRLAQNKDGVKPRFLRKRKDIVDHFYETNHTLTNHSLFHDISGIVIRLTKKSNSSNDVRYFDSELNFLEAVFDKEASIRNITTDARKDSVKKRMIRLHADRAEKLTADKRFIKRQIILLGRGWVRAGFDFGSFHENNFKYDRELGIVYLFNMKPQILACDINPWFIPEKKIKGFEIIAATSKASSPKYLNTVKENCLQKLKAQAEEAGILKRSRQYAEESLKTLFSLLLDKPINQVVLSEEPMPDFNAFIAGDSITFQTAIRLDELLLKLDSVDKDSASSAVSFLKEKNVRIRKTNHPLNRFTAWAAHVVQDSVVSLREYQKLMTIKNSLVTTRLDTLWFLTKQDQLKIQLRARTASWEKHYPGRSKGVFLMDSVVQNQTYLEYEKDFRDHVKKETQKSFLENRSHALQDLFKILGENTRTTQIAETATISSETFFKDLILPTKSEFFTD